MALCPFLFVGCWNSPYNKNAMGNPFFKKVVVAINKEPGISTLVLGGDNIYPEKVGKKKTYLLDKLRKGITDINITRIYAALGNHNIEDGAIEAYELNPKSDPYMYEAYTAAPVAASEHAPWIMPDYNYVIPFTDYNLVVIDTNAMEDPARLDILQQFLQTTLATLDKPYFLVQYESYGS